MSDVLAKNLRHFADWCEVTMRRVSGRIEELLFDEEDAPLPVTPSRMEPILSAGLDLDSGFRQLTFTFAVIALGAKLAAADGAIKQEEFTAFCSLFPMPDEEQPKIQRLFFLAHSDPNSYTHYVKQLAGLFPTQQKLREELIIRLCRLAEADGRVTLAEKRMLEGIAAALEVEKRVIHESLTTSFHSGKPLGHYELLGVMQNVTNEELKQAYRNRIRELHPDRLTAEGYASEDIDHAQAELMAVNEAYLIIARKRKIK